MSVADTIAQLHSVAHTDPNTALVKKIREDAESIARALASLHGEPFKVTFDVECQLVMISPDI